MTEFLFQQDESEAPGILRWNCQKEMEIPNYGKHTQIWKIANIETAEAILLIQRIVDEIKGS